MPQYDDPVHYRLNDRAVILDGARVGGTATEARRKFPGQLRQLCAELLLGDAFLHAHDEGTTELARADLRGPDLLGHPKECVIAWEPKLRRHDTDDLLETV